MHGKQYDLFLGDVPTKQIKRPNDPFSTSSGRPTHAIA